MIDKIIRCPRCSNILNGYKMRKIKHPSGATLDVCDRCGGMWLDGPEVKLLYAKNVRGDKKWRKKKTG